MRSLIPLVTLFFFMACGKNSELHFESRHIRPIVTEDKIGFASLSERILIPHCIKCHKGKTTEESLGSWLIPGDPENSKLYLTIKTGSMPKKALPLSSEDLEFVRQYIVSF